MTFFRSILIVAGAAAFITVSAANVSERLHNFFTFNKDGPAEEEYLHPDQAFILSAIVSDPNTLNVYWQIADGYYLYHDKFKFTIREGAAKLDTPDIIIPHGKIKEDPSFGRVEVNTGDVVIDLPVLRGSPEETSVLLEVAYQGCKDNSICYPPIKKSFSLLLPAISSSQTVLPGAPVMASARKPALSVQDRITHKLKNGGLILNVLTFLGFGLLLSLTPCVFPMIPILSGIIIGQGERITTLTAFLLSLTYVSAMAVTYAVLGIIAGSLHFNLQAAAQNTWVISLFSMVFVALALSMFGFYEIQLPAAMQNRLSLTSNKQQGGTMHGAAVMGILSAIIVGPCVAPPLAGALLYISQTGDALLGGLALFAMGMGLGIPLLIIGSSAGSFLPRAGTWMEVIKYIFGIVMLGVAIWLMQRILPAPVTLLLWGVLLIISAIYMGALDKLETGVKWKKLWKGIGIVLLVYGCALILGAASGNKDVFRPLENLFNTGTRQEIPGQLHFKRIKSVDDLYGELKSATILNKPVMLDFYADWCITCIEMEKDTFTDPGVRMVLKKFVLLQADVTENDALDKQLMAEFDLFGPPAILFFGADENEITSHRLIGFIKADEFINHLQDVINR